MCGGKESPFRLLQYSRRCVHTRALSLSLNKTNLNISTRKSLPFLSFKPLPLLASHLPKEVTLQIRQKATNDGSPTDVFSTSLSPTRMWRRPLAGFFQRSALGSIGNIVLGVFLDMRAKLILPLPPNPLLIRSQRRTCMREYPFIQPHKKII